MRMIIASMSLPFLAFGANAQLSDDDWALIRDASSTIVAERICLKTPGCSTAVVAGVEGIDKLLQFSIEKYFESEDQEFVNKNCAIIEYADGTKIKPETGTGCFTVLR